MRSILYSFYIIFIHLIFRLLSRLPDCLVVLVFKSRQRMYFVYQSALFERVCVKDACLFWCHDQAFIHIYMFHADSCNHGRTQMSFSVIYFSIGRTLTIIKSAKFWFLKVCVIVILTSFVKLIHWCIKKKYPGYSYRCQSVSHFWWSCSLWHVPFRSPKSF